MTSRTFKRIYIGVIGCTLVLIGVALLALPGPGWLTIFAGVGILATEFAFARHWLNRSRRAAHRTARTVGLPSRWRRKLRLHRRIGPHPNTSRNDTDAMSVE